jgi:hypothetical protein
VNDAPPIASTNSSMRKKYWWTSGQSHRATGSVKKAAMMVEMRAFFCSLEADLTMPSIL